MKNAKGSWVGKTSAPQFKTYATAGQLQPAASTPTTPVTPTTPTTPITPTVPATGISAARVGGNSSNGLSQGRARLINAILAIR